MPTVRIKRTVALAKLEEKRKGIQKLIDHPPSRKPVNDWDALAEKMAMKYLSKGEATFCRLLGDQTAEFTVKVKIKDLKMPPRPEIETRYAYHDKQAVKEITEMIDLLNLSEDEYVSSTARDLARLLSYQ